MDPVSSVLPDLSPRGLARTGLRRGPLLEEGPLPKLAISRRRRDRDRVGSFRLAGALKPRWPPKSPASEAAEEPTSELEWCKAWLWKTGARLGVIPFST